MSTVTSSDGRASSSCQFHVCRPPASVTTVNCHLSRSMRGVGPADSTGKSSVRYWPGGSFGSLCPRPVKPRDTTAILLLPASTEPVHHDARPLRRPRLAGAERAPMSYVRDVGQGGAQLRPDRRLTAGHLQPTATERVDAAPPTR